MPIKLVMLLAQLLAPALPPTRKPVSEPRVWTLIEVDYHNRLVAVRPELTKRECEHIQHEVAEANFCPSICHVDESAPASAECFK